jgi:hypothetical protein
MKERPILFSAPMVRAILAGTKTQTRRILKPQPEDLGGSLKWKNFIIAIPNGAWIACPYGKPGDRIWVRETWTKISECPDVLYRATGDDPCRCGKWKPSIHMPRKASRITLEISSVRIERLSDITEADAQSEGVESAALCEHTHIPQNELTLSFQYLNTKTYRSGFIKAWEGLYGIDSWDKNPWVWVIKFRRLGI